MKEKPILLSGPMIRAILANTKTQTRRIFKPDRMTWDANGRYTTHAMRGGELSITGSGPFKPSSWLHYCPYGQPGDRLWVRESWQYYDWTDDGLPCVRFAADNGTAWTKRIPQEQADRLTDIWAGLSSPENYQIDNRARDRRWRPSIHMPRWASRITLEVTGVRVERLQDISEADAVAEGCKPIRPELVQDGLIVRPGRSAVEEFRLVWEQIHGGGSWEKNPFVWVVTFRRIDHA